MGNCAVYSFLVAQNASRSEGEQPVDLSKKAHDLTDILYQPDREYNSTD
jgi:hypothetical protein